VSFLEGGKVKSKLIVDTVGGTLVECTQESEGCWTWTVEGTLWEWVDQQQPGANVRRHSPQAVHPEIAGIQDLHRAVAFSLGYEAGRFDQRHGGPA
jgi:hypothetical protein